LDANPGDPSAEERFKEIQKAYETLSNPARSPQGPARPGRAPQRPGAGTSAQGQRAQKLQDLLDKLGATGSGRERVLRLLGENLEVEVKYSFGKDDRRDREGRGGPERGGRK